MEEKSLTGLELFNPLKSQLATMRQEAMDIKVENTLDKFNAKRAHDKRMEIVKIRTSADNIKKDGKKRILEEGKKWDSIYNEIEKECKESENHLREQEEIVTKEEERQQKEREEKEALKLQSRIDSLLKYPMVYTGTGYSYLTLSVDSLTLKVMDDDSFAKFIDEVDAAFVAESFRISEETRKAKEESDRLAAENLRLQKIADDQVAEAKRLQDEKDAIEKEKQKATEAKHKARQERLFANGLIWNGKNYAYNSVLVSTALITDFTDEQFEEAVSDVTKEIKSVKDKEEKDRIAEEKRIADLAIENENKRIAKEKADAEQAEKEKQAEIERKKALAPDKEKLLEFAQAIYDLKMPTLSTETALHILETAEDTINQTIKFIQTEANKL